MNCLVTAGPTYEPLDKVRRLTNRSTGRLGTELANHLTAAGHEVTLLLGEIATWNGPCCACRIERFTTVADLHHRLREWVRTPPDAVFHAAAVSDFAFGRLFTRTASGALRVLGRAGKQPTRAGALLAELVPTPKVIVELRQWFPAAFLVGWKYEVDGTRETVIRRCQSQVRQCGTDLCVANGPAYGTGYGIVGAQGEICHAPGAAALYDELEGRLRLR